MELTKGTNAARIITFGCVTSRDDSIPFPERHRFVALLDILGMSSWTQHSEPSHIASAVECAVSNALTQSSSGSIDGAAFGPLIRSATFSDSILLYSPDVSWASFVVICSTVRSLIGMSLSSGVPLRGAISAGPMVVDTRHSLYIGGPLRDANCTDKKMRYRGVGVRLTDACIEYIAATLLSHPIPLGFRSERLEEFWAREREATDLLTRHMDDVFINQWSGPFFTVSSDADEATGHLRKCFHMRNLPVDGSVEHKFVQTLEFLRVTCLIPETVESLQKRIDQDWKLGAEEADTIDETFSSYQSELLRLHTAAQ